MKYLLIIPIKLYWLIVSETKRRSCLHNVSCSKHIYNVTNQTGLIKGIAALVHRIKTCRPGSEVIGLSEENTVLLKLVNGSVLSEKEISIDIVKIYKVI